MRRQSPLFSDAVGPPRIVDFPCVPHEYFMSTPPRSNSPSPSSASRHDDGEDTVIMSRSPHAAAPAAAQAGIVQSVLDSISDGVVAVDMHGRFVQFNPAATAILGIGPQSVPPTQWPAAYGLFLSDTATPYPAAELPLTRALQGTTTEEIEMFVKSKHCPDGKWLRVRAAPTRDSGGKQTGAVAILRDDTERKKAEQALAAKQKFLHHLIATLDRDRQLTAFDLHDGVVQLMTGAMLRLEAYRGKQPNETVGEDVTIATQLVRESIDEARQLIGGLSPPVIDDQGVVGAIAWLAENYCRDSQMRVDFAHHVQFTRLPALQESTIFRIVQEALHNARRHSGSKQAWVRLKQQDDNLHLEIRDEGKGFDVAAKHMTRFGLRGIEERSRLLGGLAQIETAPGQGTTIRVSLPIDITNKHELFETEL